jgi:uncharacterized membrane protein YfcA
VHLALAALAVAGGACAQTVSGIGFALVSGPFLVALMGVRAGVPASLMLSVLVNVAVLARERRGIRWRDAVLLFVPAAIVTPLAAYGVRRLGTVPASLIAGLAALSGAVAVAAGWRSRRLAGLRGAVVAGALSGAMNAAASIGGPPAALYADQAGWASEETRATLQVYFLPLNLLALASLGVHAISPVLPAALVVGAAVGALLVDRLPGGVARPVTLTLAAAGGLVVVARALAAA